MGPGLRRDDGRTSLRPADHRLQIIIRLDDLDQAVLGGAVAAIGAGTKAEQNLASNDGTK